MKEFCKKDMQDSNSMEGQSNPAYEGEAGQRELEITDREKGEKKVKEKEEEERQQWSNPVEFLLSCIAMSVRHVLLGFSVSFCSTSSLCCSG